MKALQTEKYFYTRTKNVVPTESGLELFLFAGLIRELKQQLGDSIRTKVESVLEEMIEEPLHSSHPLYRDLPNETVMVEVSGKTFKELQQLVESDLMSFFLFNVKG